MIGESLSRKGCMMNVNESLRAAARAGDIAELNALLFDPECDALSKGLGGWTALMCAACDGYEEAVRILLPMSDAATKDNNGVTALMYASCFGHVACVSLLLPVSDVLAKTDTGLTALMMAAANGCEACVRLLLPISDLLDQDNKGMTASDLARSTRYENTAQFIEAYVLSQSEHTSIGVAVGPEVAPKKSGLRV